MQRFPFENTDIVLDEDGPFAEYLRTTSQRLDNVRYEKYEDAINQLSYTSPKPQPVEFENNEQITNEIDFIERQIRDKEYSKCLQILHIMLPCLIQPITKHQQTINDIISDFSYNVESDVMHQIYAGLYSYFYDTDNENTDENKQEATQTLFTSTLIISNRFILFFTLILHLFIVYIMYAYKIIVIFEILNIIFIVIDIYEYYEWISFFYTLYELIHYLNSFQSFVDKSFKILNNTTAIVNGYSLHHQFIASYKIEQKNPTKIHLNNLRFQLYETLIDINCFLYKMTSFIANNDKKLGNDISEGKLNEKREKLMLKDLLLLYKHFRIHQKILFVQLYRISNPLIYSNKLNKSIRGIWFKGIIFNKSQINYMHSPFSPYQLRLILNYNKFYHINCLLIQLCEKFRNANITLFTELKLCKKPKQFNRFSSNKIMKDKDKKLSKIEQKIDRNGGDKQRLHEIYNHLYRLQNRIDSITSYIYLMHEQCIINPLDVIGCESKSDKNESETEIDNIDIENEIENNKSLEIMRDLIFELNRSFNEWKFIVSKINSNCKLLNKYQNIGFDAYNYKGLKYDSYEQQFEHVIETDNENDNKMDDIKAYKQRKKNMMKEIFGKLNKQRAKMSITDDGEELYEPTQETKNIIKQVMETKTNNNNNNNNNNNRDLLDASMGNGSAVSYMDKYNMVDELKNVLKNRKNANIQRFKHKNVNDIKENIDEKTEEMEEEKNSVYNIMNVNKMERMENIRNSYREEVIENEYNESSDDGLIEEDTLNEEQEKRFLNELNRLGLSHNALMTMNNVKINDSFEYNSNRNMGTMSLFARLQSGDNNRNGINDENNNEIIEEVEDNENENEEIENGNNEWNINKSELQKSLQEQRSDDEGGTLADELGALM